MATRYRLPEALGGIADLPPCKQCDKSKARRIEGRPA